MPKIALRYVGDDKKQQERLKATGGVSYHEPVDAREILATPGNDYEIDEDSRKLIGLQYNPALKGLNVPQLQGDDAEMQTGLSADKYGRSQVVKAIPDGSAPAPTAMRPMSTTARPLDLDAARAGEQYAVGDPRFTGQQQQLKPASEGLKVEDMKELLDKRGIQYPHDAKKPELAELVDRHNVRAE